MQLKIQIIKNEQKLDSFSAETEAELLAWLQVRIEHKVFGAEARTEQRLVSEAIPAVLDEDGTELVAEIPAVYETIEIPAEYSYEISDITAEIEQAKINTEALSYLAATDWYILRELDEGTPCPVEIKQARAEARAKIVK